MSLLMARGSCLGAWQVPPGLCPPLPAYLVLCLFCCRNAEKILGYLHSNVLSRDLIPPHVNFSHLTTKDYTEMYKVIMTVKEDRFSALGLDPCLLEDELNKVRTGCLCWVGPEGIHRGVDPHTSHEWLELACRPQKAARDSLIYLVSEDLLCV